MFDSTSRYVTLPTAEFTLPDGRVVVYKRRRFLPRGEAMLVLAEVSVAEGERLDHITARFLGDPRQFWRICDANNTMNPVELTAAPGGVLRVPIPQI